VVGWFVFVAIVFVAGGAAGTRALTSAEQGTGESGRADRVVEQAGFPATPTERILIRSRSGPLDQADAQAAATQLRSKLSALPVVGKIGTLTMSKDGSAAMLPVVLDVDGKTGDDALTAADDKVPAVLAATAAVARGQPDLRIQEVGDASVDAAVGHQISADFNRAERLSLPITLLILLLTFGALIAAGVPVVLALSAVAAAIGLSALVSHVLPVMDALNSVILLIGMAVGVDYSLFYVRRAREERARGASRADAIELAARTSGRAVVVSGLAVFVAMSGLLLSGDATFTSMAVGTMLVVAVAVLGSLTVLPAMLSLLGDRIDRPRIPFIHRLRRGDGAGRFWPAVMRVVLHKPLVSLLLAGTAMVALAVPALGMRTGEAGADSLPRSIPIMKTYDAMTAAFPQTGFAHTVVVWSPDGKPLDRAALNAGVDDMINQAEATGRFASLSDVHAVVAPDGKTAQIDLPVTGDFNTDRSQRSLAAVREHIAPTLAAHLPAAEVATTGDTAYTVDFGSQMRAHLPWVMAFVLGLTFLVLVVSFRSVVIAATAVALNLLSVGAAYGLLVLVFQHGLGQGLLDFRSNGTIIDWLPLFLFVVLFGLSMDYHVFVVSRIREAYAAGMPTRLAVAHGVTSSAGVVTSAAAVMVGVFSIFGTLSLLEFKQLGVGLAAAVLIDATIVRAVLLPAAMTLLGRRNWWLPAWLDRRLPAAH
jgi:RND superfamily putative drug exporter